MNMFALLTQTTQVATFLCFLVALLCDQSRIPIAFVSSFCAEKVWSAPLGLFVPTWESLPTIQTFSGGVLCCFLFFFLFCTCVCVLFLLADFFFCFQCLHPTNYLAGDWALPISTANQKTVKSNEMYVRENLSWCMWMCCSVARWRENGLPHVLLFL